MTNPEQPIGYREPQPATGANPFADDPVLVGGAPPTNGAGTGQDAAQTARNEASRVARTGKDHAAHVAHTAKDEADEVVAEAKDQARALLDQARLEVAEQTGIQLGRLSAVLHSFSQELGAMASSSPEDGTMTQLAREASRKGGEIAHWLGDREPADVLGEATSFARRRPGSFLGACFAAGLAAGRLVRGAQSMDGADAGRGADINLQAQGTALDPLAPRMYRPAGEESLR